MAAQSELIFRLETMDGKGAYQGNLFASNTDGNNNQNYNADSDLHPSPHWHDSIEFTREHIFGFSDLADARRWWFDVADLRRWHKDGLRLVIWPSARSEDVVYGKRQIAFKPPEEDPLRLPAYAIHEFSEETIRDMVADHFGE